MHTIPITPFVPPTPLHKGRAPAGAADTGFKEIVDASLTVSGQSASAGNTSQTATARPSFGEQLSLYLEEQLVSSPGAKNFDFSKGYKISADERPMDWGDRVVKDVEDASLNVLNFFKDAVTGGDKYYKTQEGTIAKTRSSPGLLGSLVDFVKDFASALSLGAWRPDGEAAPDGVMDHLAFAASKLKEAFGGDLVGGALGSVVQMGEDLLLAGWNLTEAVPDALFGMFESGRVAVDTIFDNGQVAIDYITDVIPGGEAWMRVHASHIIDGRFPVLYNLQTPEHFTEDLRWETIQNTPFRKSIETIGSLLADAALIFLVSQGITISDSRR